MVFLTLFCVCFPAKVKFTKAPYGLKPVIYFFFQFLKEARLCQAMGLHGGQTICFKALTLAQCGKYTGGMFPGAQRWHIT